MPLFSIGLTSLSPGARITCFWDDLDNQLAFLRSNDLDGEDFQVTVSYTDLPGAQYWNTWDIQPAIYEGLRPPARPAEHTDDQAGEPTQQINEQSTDERPVPATTGAPEGT